MDQPLSYNRRKYIIMYSKSSKIIVSNEPKSKGGKAKEGKMRITLSATMCLMSLVLLRGRGGGGEHTNF